MRDPPKVAASAGPSRTGAALVIADVVSRWHAFMRGELPGGLDELLDDDVVFYSPIVFTPQFGKEITSLYLRAASQTFVGDSGGGDVAGEGGGGHQADQDSTSTAAAHPGRFHYTKTVLGNDTAMLEFETTMKGKYVNGIDIIRCNDQDRIVEFRVMIRPLQAVNLVHEQMKAMLESMTPRD
jgi:hypothetical protein